MTAARRAGWAVLGLALPGAAFLLWRQQASAPRARAGVVDVESAETRGGAAGQPRRPSVPKFLAPAEPGASSDSDGDDRSEAAAGIDELGAAEVEAIDRIEDAIRAEAAVAVGLSHDERARVAAIRADFAARRRRFETQIDPTTRMLEPLASAAVMGNGRAERQRISRALGQDRAAALREAELAAWARLRADANARPSPAASRMLARRFTPPPSRPVPAGPAPPTMP